MALVDVLAASVVRPVYVAWFDIKDDPIYGWTGPGAFAPTGTGDTDLDGNVFLSSEGVVQVSGFHEDQGLGSELTLTFAISTDIAPFILDQSQLDIGVLGTPGGPVYDQLVIDRRRFIGRRAKIWLFFLNADEASVMAEFEVVFNGVMTGAAMNRAAGQPSTVSLTIDQDTQKRRAPPSRLMDHARFNPGDTATSFLSDMRRGSVAGASQSPAPWNNNWNSYDPPF